MLYGPEYDNLEIRGVEAPRPWNLGAEIKERLQASDTLVDIGCGTMRKLFDVAPFARQIIGIEPSPAMRARARENILEAEVWNMTVLEGSAEALPLRSGSVDFISSMVAPHDTEEIHRVLKPGGRVVLEKIGDRDKDDIKRMFEREGFSRSKNSDFGKGELAEHHRAEFAALFSEVAVRNEFWQTTYTLDGLVKLFEQTNDIKDFDQNRDADIIVAIRDTFGEEGIITRQNRILITARKSG